MNFKRYQFLRQEAVKKLKTAAAEQTFLYPPVDQNMPAGGGDSLLLAYLGDAAYSLFVRRQMMLTGISKVQILHDLVTEFICAASQAKAFLTIEELLTEEEQEIARRARNSNVNVPRSSTVQEYRLSTAFEAVLGHLYLTGQAERLKELSERAFTAILETL